MWSSASLILLYFALFCAKAGAGLPTAHMGGVGGFTSLADGIDRALAGALKPSDGGI